MVAGPTAVDEAERVIVEETVLPFAGETQAMEGVEVWVYTYAPMSQPEP
jgi:hypothetical protein